MDDEKVGQDLVIECYAALVDEPAADTCCKCICIMARRMRDDNHFLTHETHFIVLANQLMSVTKTFGRYIAEMHFHMQNGEYDAALLVGEEMVRHEAMLHQIAAGKPLQHTSTMN